MDKWDKRFIKLAKYISSWSKDPRTQVGSVIVAEGGKNQVAFGYNGFPPGVSDTPERLHNREMKHMFVQHAERNALDNAVFSTKGATLYTTKFPCVDCTKSIISKGIVRIVTPKEDDDSFWKPQTAVSIQMMEEAKVDIEYFTEKL